MSLLTGISLVILGTVIGSFGALFLKLGSGEFSLKPAKLLKNWRILAGAVLYLISSVPFIIALRYGDLSVLYPFVATSYIFVTILSIWVLKERMNSWKWFGIMAIIVGVVFIGLGA